MSIPQLVKIHSCLKAKKGDVYKINLQNEIFISFYEQVQKTYFLLYTDDFTRIENWLKEFTQSNICEVKIVSGDLFAKQFTKLFPNVIFKHNNTLGNKKEIFYYGENGRIRLGDVGGEVSKLDISNQTKSRIKVLIVDDSQTIRNLLEKIIGADPELEVVGSLERPSLVEAAIVKLKPDVMTLDINMPEMDGVTLLSQIYQKYKIPTIMISSLSLNEGNQVLTALEIGAVDYIQKPDFKDLKEVSRVILEKIKVASKVKTSKTSVVKNSQIATTKKFKQSYNLNQHLLVAIGSSTGGTEALRAVLEVLPSNIPPIVIVQHIPPVFSKAFADRLNEICQFEVLEAKDGDDCKPGRVLIAPGGKQMELISSPLGYKVRVFDGEPVNRHKPSVDVLFNSVAKLVGKKSIGIILTGMGADGAKGLLEMKNKGSKTIAQDEHSCVVYGMPKAAVELGAAQSIKPLEDIPHELLNLLEVKLGDTSKAA